MGRIVLFIYHVWVTKPMLRCNSKYRKDIITIVKMGSYIIAIIFFSVTNLS